MAFSTDADQEIYTAIVSKGLTHDFRSLALTAGGDGYVYAAVLNYHDDNQAWRITRDSNGFLTIFSKSFRRYVARQINVDALILVDDAYLNDSSTRPHALWRDDNVSGEYNAINSASDWEAKIDMPGDGPWLPGKIVFTHKWNGGGDNQLWAKLPIIQSTRMKEITFSIDMGTVADESPVVAASQIVTNQSGTDQSQLLHFAFIESHKYSFTKEQGAKVSMSVEFQAGLPIIGASKVKVSVEGSWKFSESTESSDENEVSLDVPVMVPAHTSIQVDVLVLRASLDVPYQATVTYVHPDLTETDVQTSGVFTGENGYNVITHFQDLGIVRQFERRPFKRSAATRR